MKTRLVSGLLLVGVFIAPLKLFAGPTGPIDLLRTVSDETTTEMHDAALTAQIEGGIYTRQSYMFEFGWGLIGDDIKKLKSESLRLTFFDNEICTVQSSKLKQENSGNWIWTVNCVEPDSSIELIIAPDKSEFAGGISLSGGNARVRSFNGNYGVAYRVDPALVPSLEQ